MKNDALKEKRLHIQNFLPNMGSILYSFLQYLMLNYLRVLAWDMSTKEANLSEQSEFEMFFSAHSILLDVFS